MAPHLSTYDAAAVAGSLALDHFVPGAVALFDWVEELRGREELFVVDNEDDEGDEGEEVAAAAERRRSESSDESDDDGESDDGPPSPPPLPSFASSSSSTQPGTYTTVAAEHSETYEVKKSTFIATCFPIKTSEEAEARIRERSDPGARHNCWAFVTPGGDDARCSDDGEPGGTAGRPILSSIASAGEGGGALRGVAVVVARWKAGPKLGASGLVRAYAHSARLALSAATRVTVEAEALVSVAGVPLSDLGRVFGCLERHGATRLGEEGGGEEKEGEGEAEGGPSSRITLRVSLPKKELENLRSAVASATSGRARVVAKM